MEMDEFVLLVEDLRRLGHDLAQSEMAKLRAELDEVRRHPNPNPNPNLSPNPNPSPSPSPNLGRAAEQPEEREEQGLVVRRAHPVEGVLGLASLEDAHLVRVTVRV